MTPDTVHRAALVANGGLAAVLGFLDFFSVSLQRVSVGVAANICKAVRPELFSQAEGVVPNLSALLLVWSSLVGSYGLFLING